MDYRRSVHIFVYRDTTYLTLDTGPLDSRDAVLSILGAITLNPTSLLDDVYKVLYLHIHILVASTMCFFIFHIRKAMIRLSTQPACLRSSAMMTPVPIGEAIGLGAGVVGAETAVGVISQVHYFVRRAGIKRIDLKAKYCCRVCWAAIPAGKY